MKYTGIQHSLKFSVDLCLASSLNLRSGAEGEFADTSLPRTPDGDLSINGYVWSSLLRRAFGRTVSGQALAEAIGKHDPKNPLGVSPLWCEATYADIDDPRATAIVPGIRIDRKMGSAAGRALYSQEIVTPGLPLTLKGNLFVTDRDIASARSRLMEALWIINDGIETIGGSWSYGYGRLKVKHVRTAELDLSNPDNRARLWEYDGPWQIDEDWDADRMAVPMISRPWSHIKGTAAIPAGQLLAVHTKIPPDGYPATTDMPDDFVMRLPMLADQGTVYVDAPIVSGKAFRQAVLSQGIERSLRSQGEDICLDSTQSKYFCLDGKQNAKCQCRRCQWFGNTEKSGIISVADAPVQDWDTMVMHRIQLCEHSQQNMNLFNGEYLCAGNFTFDIIVDRAVGCDPQGLTDAIEKILNEVQTGPPGWHRLGATSTCTGQIEITDYTITPRGGDHV